MIINIIRQISLRSYSIRDTLQPFMTSQHIKEIVTVFVGFKKGSDENKTKQNKNNLRSAIMNYGLPQTHICND